jgi:hypothetical protein
VIKELAPLHRQKRNVETGETFVVQNCSGNESGTGQRTTR